ncbi:MAG: CRTAC1 family protein [Sumerlaeia bacterium]
MFFSFSRSVRLALAPALLTVAGALAAPPALQGIPPATAFTDQGGTLLGGDLYELRSASFADIDNDGDLDILLQGSTDSRRLYRNLLIENGSLAFEDITATHGPAANDTSGWSAAWGDYNGDGLVDVFLGQTNGGSSRGDLFRNDGAAGFTDVSATTINDPGFAQNVAWADIDNDRDLDLLIAMEGPEKHEVYIQEVDGSFTQSGLATGFQAPFGTKCYGMAIGDPDADGDMDVYLSTCRVGGNIRNNFFENRTVEDGALAFVDIADTNGTQYLPNSYATQFLDFDDDGDLDLFMSGADQEDNKIWRNDGGGAWTDVDTITGTPLTPNNGGDFNGARAIDYDNDGDLDLFFHDHKPFNGVTNARSLFRNEGDWAFVEVTADAGIAALNEGAYDSAWGDVDNDGDLDLLAPTDGSFPTRLFLSDASENGNHWVQVRLRGIAPNTRAIGAALYVTVNAGTPQERTYRRDANTNAGAFNQSDTPVHFGLGAASVIDRLRIVWPGGREQVIDNPAVDMLHVIDFPQFAGVMVR